MLNQALNNTGGSLGAYMLIYLYFQDYTENDFISLIEEVLILRKHGVPTMEEIQNITKDKLDNLKQESYKHLEKLLEEI